ncbi:homoserine kinase, partial [Quercus suber]
VFASVKTFAPTTVANLGPSFDFLSCTVDSLRDFVSLSIYSSVHLGEISIMKISARLPKTSATILSPIALELPRSRS